MKRISLILFIALTSAFSLKADASAPPTPKQQQVTQPTAPQQSVDIDDEPELPFPAATTSLPANNYKKQFTGTLIAIVIIVFLVFFIIWLLRRFSSDRPLHMNHRKHIKVIERRPLSPNTFIYLIQVGDKQFVIAESKFHVHNVATLDWNETTPD